MEAMSPEEKRVMFKVWKTCNKMLKARKYNVLQSDLDLTFEQFEETYGNVYPSRDHIILLASKEDDDKDLILVRFPADEKVQSNTIKDLTARMKEQSVRRAILVIKNEITHHARKCMQLLEPELIFDLFHQTDLMVNIMEHALVPLHIVLNDEEKSELLQRYNVKESQLPRMQKADAISKYLGLECGQVVKIVRPSETAGRYITYRFVT